MYGPAMCIDLQASYLQNGLGGDTIMHDYTNGCFNAPVMGIISGGFGDSLRSLLSYKYLGCVVGLNLRIPIQAGWGYPRGAHY
jgi:hypothetical protein